MNFYEYLQVSPSASSQEIHKAFRKMAKLKHPDVNQKDSAFWDMVELNIIRDTLLNPEKRTIYDRSLNGDNHETTSIYHHTRDTQQNTNVFHKIKQFFTYRCKVCGIEMHSTWNGYCLHHYLEQTDQMDNPDGIFEYAGIKYKWKSDEKEYNSRAGSNQTRSGNYRLIITTYIVVIGIIILTTFLYAQNIFQK